jgi:hypothetical protein
MVLEAEVCRPDGKLHDQVFSFLRRGVKLGFFLMAWKLSNLTALNSGWSSRDLPFGV